MEVANNNVSSHVSATRSREGCLQRLPSTVAASGQLGNTQMSPSGHTANLSDLDSLSGSRLHDAEEVNHTAFGPASEPYDEQRHLLYPVDAVDAVGQAGRSSLASSDHIANSANSDVPLHRGLQERQGNAMSIAYTQQMLSNDEQDGGACGEPQGSEDTKFLHSLTHPNTPPPEEADELLDTQRQASLLDSVQLLFEKKMMMEVINGEQVTFRRMDEILENVTHALELPLRQAERVVAEACRQWGDLEKLATQKLRIINNIRKMCVRMDKGRLPTVLKALEAIEDAEPEVATTLFKELHATLTTKVTIEASPVKRTRTENTVIAQPPAAATTVTATSTPPKPKQMQAASSIRRQPQRSSKKTAAGVQRADENVIAHEH